MTDRLNPNEQLLQGQFITSANGRFTLILQGDGNLVLYKPGGKPIWATGTSGPVTAAIMQQDGNLVLYTPQGPIWASNTQGNNVLVAQDDGNLVMYNNAGGAIWASNTSGDLHLQRSSALGSGHYMDTNAALTPDGKLSVSTRTRTVTWFGGYTGGVMIGVVDANGIVIDRVVNRFGVDGTAVGRSDRTDTWEAYFGPDTANRASQLFIAHYWDPKVKMEEMVRIGIILVEIIVEILRYADADIALGG